VYSCKAYLNDSEVKQPNKLKVEIVFIPGEIAKFSFSLAAISASVERKDRYGQQ